MSQGYPGVAFDGLSAAFPCLDRAARWLATLCIVASSAGCILTTDLPDPALDIPDRYKAARLTDKELRQLQAAFRIAAGDGFDRFYVAARYAPDQIERCLQDL